MTFLMRINTFLTYLFDLFFCCGLKAAAKYMIRAFSTLMGCKLYKQLSAIGTNHIHPSTFSSMWKKKAKCQLHESYPSIDL